MSLLKRLKYPKLLLFVITIIIAYMIFSDESFSPIRQLILSSGIIGLFLAGILFDYGFTSAPAIAVLLLIAPEYNIFLAVFIAGLGSVAGDVLIFKLIRCSFSEEIKKLNKTKLIKEMECCMPPKIRHYAAIVLAGFIIASPLPDEIGVPLLAAAYHKLSTKKFAFLSFILHTIMIFIILLIGKIC